MSQHACRARDTSWSLLSIQSLYIERQIASCGVGCSGFYTGLITGGGGLIGGRGGNISGGEPHTCRLVAPAVKTLIETATCDISEILATVMIALAHCSCSIQSQRLYC